MRKTEKNTYLKGMNKLLITGSRTLTNYDELSEAIANAVAKYGAPEVLLHGGADGADTLAQRWADNNGIRCEVIKPNYKEYGKRAPLVRNNELVNRASVVVAIYDGKKTNGTSYTAKAAIAKGLPTMETLAGVRVWHEVPTLF